MPYASILAQKNKQINQCIREADFQQKVSVFRCLFLDAGKSDSDTCNMEPETLITKPGLWGAGSLRWNSSFISHAFLADHARWAG